MAFDAAPPSDRDLASRELSDWGMAERFAALVYGLGWRMWDGRRRVGEPAAGDLVTAWAVETARLLKRDANALAESGQAAARRSPVSCAAIC